MGLFTPSKEFLLFLKFLLELRPEDSSSEGSSTITGKVIVSRDFDFELFWRFPALSCWGVVNCTTFELLWIDLVFSFSSSRSLISSTIIFWLLSILLLSSATFSSKLFLIFLSSYRECCKVDVLFSSFSYLCLISNYFSVKLLSTEDNFSTIMLYFACKSDIFFSEFSISSFAMSNYFFFRVAYRFSWEFYLVKLALKASSSEILPWSTYFKKSSTLIACAAGVDSLRFFEYEYEWFCETGCSMDDALGLWSAMRLVSGSFFELKRWRAILIEFARMF